MYLEIQHISYHKFLKVQYQPTQKKNVLQKGATIISLFQSEYYDDPYDHDNYHHSMNIGRRCYRCY